ncbi:MAG: 8-oxo-dGTP diphosphatase MutT [Methylophaga sp.]|nr:MAG: 8-oxo-dGTP diphosphatase MutT [Methylophaga sp.]
MTSTVHVAVAIIVNTHNEVLLALRQAHQHQGGFWEFPGGKVEANESVYDALVREIEEEIGIIISSAQDFLALSHDYEDKSVLLDIWRVTEYSGKPQGQEGQQLRWCAINDLAEDEFPAANVAIIRKLKSECTTK